MNYKWNGAKAQHYAEEFSSLICKDFFQSKDNIEGNELAEVTVIRQLNMMIIKNMFNKWQGETKQLRSPFFNYEHEEVQKALQQFMNVLSQHISIRKDSFETLLSQSTLDTLQLVQAPKSYFERELRNLPDFKLTKEWLVKNEKYFFFNKHVLSALKERLGDSVTYANQAIVWLNDIMDTTENEDPRQILDDFNRVLPLWSEEEHNEGKSFFDDALEKAMYATQKVAKREPVPQQHSEEPVWAKYISPKTAVSNESIAGGMLAPEAATVATEERMASPKAEHGTPVQLDKRLNEMHQGARITFNERLSKPSNGTSLSDRKHKIQNLKEGISLNQRYLYIRDLFGGDHQAFVHSLEQLETYASLQEARRHLENTVSKKFQWESSPESVEDFYGHLERRFS